MISNTLNPEKKVRIFLKDLLKHDNEYLLNFQKCLKLKPRDYTTSLLQVGTQ